ncbi:unnamed protein product [Paramecium octaurelia]|uniref:NACHT domain-containing protein n=1 Tax=Paramecium octaurelia TaxID=43137 RepID=A0A8S1WFH5_PAROT|nr:unnamed protein product [Paramecium octaurelia]
MYNNQEGILDSIVSNDKIQLRGGGICSSKPKNIQQTNPIEELQIKLQQFKKIRGELDQQLQTILIKECLDLIVNIYKGEIKNIDYHQLFYQDIEWIDTYLRNEDGLSRQCCLQYYLELISISLKNLLMDVSQRETSINIIDLFIKISKEQNNNSKEKNNNSSISQLIETASILLIDVQSRYYYQLQKFETYYFFNTLSQIIKELVVQGVQVDIQKNLDNIKNDYIQNSSNWTLHNYWVEISVDLLIFCYKFKEQNKHQPSKAQKADKIISYIWNSKNIFEIYINDFHYKEFQNNSWEQMNRDNHEFYRLQRILSMFTSLVQQIKTKFQDFSQYIDLSVQQIFQIIYHDFKFIDIHLLEIYQSIYKIEKKQNDQLMRSLIATIQDEIKNHFWINSIVDYYCQLQMIENGYVRQSVLDDIKELLNSQIEKFSLIVTDVQNLILQERISKSNIQFQDIGIKKIFQSQQHYSSQSSPTIETQKDLQLKINIHLQQYKIINLFQKIKNFKHGQTNPDLPNEIKNKITELKQLIIKIRNPEQLNYCIEEFYKIKRNYCFNHLSYIFIESTIIGFWDEPEFPLIYKSLYQEFEQIRGCSNEDTHKIKQSLKFHLQIIEDKQLIIYLRNKILPVLKNLNNLNAPSQTNYEQQNFFDILTQFDSASNLSTGSQEQGEESQELKTIIKRKADNMRRKTNKIEIALNTQNKRYDDLKNQFVNVGQTRQLFKGFGSSQDPKDSLDAEINDFIWSKQNQNVVLVISGPNGCGKTNTLKKLENQLLQHYKANPYGHNWIPIYVNLLSIHEPEKNLLNKAILSKYRQLNKMLQEFYLAILKGQENVVLILDSNYITNNLDLLNQFKKKIKNLNQNVTLKIIISTRKDFNSLQIIRKKNIQFTEIQLINSSQQQEYIKQSYKSIVKVQQDSEAEVDLIFQTIPNFYIIPENSEENLKNELKKFITEEDFERLSQKMKKMKNFFENILNPYLKDILLTPLLLKIAIKHFQRSENLENLLSININGRVKARKEDQELILLPNNSQIYSKYKVLTEFMKKCLYQRKKKNQSPDRQITFKDLLINLKQSQILINNQGDLGLEISKIESINNSKLIAFNNNQIQFLHKQILDLFIAEKIAQLFFKSRDEIINFLNNEQVNLSQQHYEGVVELLVDPQENRLQKINTLSNIVKLSKTDKQKVRASSNAIFLLSKLGARLEGQDFKGIEIENTSMIGLNAIQCDFTQCKITNVELDFANFHGCKLINSEFNDVSCCEFPEINEEDVVLYDFVQCCQYSPDGKKLLIVSSKKTLFYNIDQNTYVRIFQLVDSFCFHPIKNILVTFSKQGLQFWQIDEEPKLMPEFDKLQEFKGQKLIFSQDGKWLVLCNNQSVSIMNISTILYNKQVQPEDVNQIPNFNYNENDQFNFSIDLLQFRFETNQLLKFNPQTQQCDNIKDFDENCKAQTFSPSGKYIAFANINSKEVIIYNISNKEKFLDSIIEQKINTIQFSKNEEQLYLVTENHNQIQIYFIKERNSMRELQYIQVIRLNQRVNSLQFHPKDLQFLVVAKNGEILFFNYKQDSNQYQMSKKITYLDELCFLNTDISSLKITSKIPQQNLHKLFKQKGAKN